MRPYARSCNDAPLGASLHSMAGSHSNHLGGLISFGLVKYPHSYGGWSHPNPPRLVAFKESAKCMPLSNQLFGEVLVACFNNMPHFPVPKKSGSCQMEIMQLEIPRLVVATCVLDLRQNREILHQGVRSRRETK